MTIQVEYLLIMVAAMWLAGTVYTAATGKPTWFFWNIHRAGLSAKKAIRVGYWALPIFLFLLVAWPAGVLIFAANLLARRTIKSKGLVAPELAR